MIDITNSQRFRKHFPYPALSSGDFCYNSLTHKTSNIRASNILVFRHIKKFKVPIKSTVNTEINADFSNKTAKRKEEQT